MLSTPCGSTYSFCYSHYAVALRNEQTSRGEVIYEVVLKNSNNEAPCHEIGRLIHSAGLIDLAQSLSPFNNRFCLLWQSSSWINSLMWAWKLPLVLTVLQKIEDPSPLCFLIGCCQTLLHCLVPRRRNGKCLHE